MMEILSVNRVIKEKVKEECHRVLAQCRLSHRWATTAADMDELTAERAVLVALSDLLAVFRAT
jgi:hypothetical protein